MNDAAHAPPSVDSARLRLCMYVNYCAYAIQLNSVGIAVLQSQRSFGVSLVAASTLAMFKGAGILCGALLAGAFLGKLGHKRAMQIALAGSALALVVVPLQKSFSAVQFVFLATGLCYGLMKVALYATVGLVAPDRRQHASVLSFVEASYKIGSFMAFFLFAAFTNDADPKSTSWTLGYAVLAGVMAFAFILLLRARIDESRAHGRETRSPFEGLREMAQLAVTPIALTLACLVFAAISVEHAFINLLPTFNSRVVGLAPSLSMQIAAIYASCAIVGRLGVGFLLRRVSWLPVTTACLIGATVLLIVGLAFTQSPVEPGAASWRDVPPGALLLPLTGLFIGPLWPMIHSAALTLLPVERHGTLASLSVVFSSTSGAIATPLLGMVFAWYGGVVAFACLLVPIVMLALGAVGLRRIRT